LTCAFALVSTLLAGCVAGVAVLAGSASAQGDAPVRGLYHFVHSTADAERSFAFLTTMFSASSSRDRRLRLLRRPMCRPRGSRRAPRRAAIHSSQT
jgi:hypothetical protein